MKKLTPRFIKSKNEARAWSFWAINYFTACGFMEILPWVGSGYDMERFGIMIKRVVIIKKIRSILLCIINRFS